MPSAMCPRRYQKRLSAAASRSSPTCSPRLAEAVQRSAEVVVLEVEPSQPADLIGTGQMLLGRLGDSGEMRRVATRPRHVVADPVDRVFAHAVEQPVPAIGRLDQARVDERRQRVHGTGADDAVNPSRSKPPANTASPMKTSRSRGESSSKLQSIAARRSDAAQPRRASLPRAPTGRRAAPRRSFGGSVRSHGAASSIASGEPSSLAQTASIAASDASIVAGGTPAAAAC